jgi:tight adherence protein B
MTLELSPVDLLLAAALAAVTVFLLGIAFVLGARDKRNKDRRMRRAQGAVTSDDRSASLSVRRDTTDAKLPILDTLIKSLMPNPEKLRARLARTGRRISIGQFLMSMLVLGSAVAVAIRMTTNFGAITCILVGLVVGVAVPHFTIGHLGKRRLFKFNNLFPEAIDLIVRGLRSGLPVSESIKQVAREIADPVGTEFNQIADSITFGMTMQEALWAAAGRLDIPEYRFFAITLAIQQETGGNLAETLENLSTVLRRRKQMRLKIKALSSEAKASAYIIGSLPFVMFGIILVMNPTYAMKLFNDPRGLVMVGAGFCCYGLGIGIMAKMIRFEI